MSVLLITIAYPVDLPLPVLDYSGAPRYNTIVGPDNTFAVDRRSRFTRSYALLSVSWALTVSQFAAFKTFFRTTLGNGTSQFEIELRYPLNSALQQWAVKIANGYQATYNDGIWTITSALDLVNPINF